MAQLQPNCACLSEDLSKVLRGLSPQVSLASGNGERSPSSLTNVFFTCEMCLRMDGQGIFRSSLADTLHLRSVDKPWETPFGPFLHPSICPLL